MATDVELLGCPWCGERRAEILEGGNSSWGRCYSCRAEGPVKGAYAEARAAWNTRPSPTQEQREAVARIIDPRLADDEWVRNFRMYVNEVQDIALAKADAILALIQPQGQAHD